jgi:alkanesulfonate monooxygenase SsuD/methylene tetrahydromethanopterin reductase-like flavin-dependent oxidoreductase (luciferase family)
MLRLAGELCDGVILNWCTAEQIAWSRERIAEGATRAGRNPAEVRVAQFIRVCIDDDRALARRTYAAALRGYALGRGLDAKGRPQGYRAHFERMGFAEPLAAVDTVVASGAPADSVADAFPDDLLNAVGYYGPAAGAREALARIGEGLDSLIVRIVATNGIESVRRTISACSPDAIGAAG